MFEHAFIVYALIAGTAIAVLSSALGMYLVPRGQLFAGDALGHVAYTGAMTALALGVDLRLGLFVAVVATGLALGSTRRAIDDVAIGAVFTWLLGLGVLMLSYYTSHRSAGNGTASVSVLFGSIFGLTRQTTVQVTAISIAALVAVLAIGRPLLFATLQPELARARRLPVRLLGAALLAITGVAVAQATQVVGAMIVLGLLAAPAATALAITARPWHAFWLSTVLGTAAVWVGVTVSWYFPRIPATFSIVAVATSWYVAATVWSAIRSRRSRAEQRPVTEVAVVPSNAV